MLPSGTVTFFSKLDWTFNRFSLFYSDLVAELPFILMHPKPEYDDDATIIGDLSPNRRSIDRSKQASSKNDKNANEKDETPNLIQLDG